MKEKPISNVLKRWGSNFLKGFNVQLRYFFGGQGGKISVMDMVRLGRGLFGAIDDPDDLAQEVRSKIRKKFPQLECDDCVFRDRKTLIDDLDEEHRADYNDKIRQKISLADYSLCVRIRKDNPVQPFMDRKTLAGIVTMSIKGLFKAVKNVVKTDDVILLRGNGLHYRDEKEIFRLENMIPTYAQIERILEKAHGSNVKAYDEIEGRFDKIHTKKDYENSRRCRRAMRIWDEFKKNYPSGSKLNAVSPVPKEAFKEFLAPYAEFRKDEFGENVNVSESMAVAYDVIRDLLEGGRDFGGCVEAVFEDEPGEKRPLSKEELTKLTGAIKEKITAVASETIKQRKNKVSFSPGMSKFARVEVGELADIEDSEAYRVWGLGKDAVAAAVQKARDENYEYFIIAYFKIPKEIDVGEIGGKKTAAPGDELDEGEDRVMKRVKAYFKTENPDLNRADKKDDALKDDVVQGIIQKWTRASFRPSPDEVRAKIEEYFRNPKNFSTPGASWKGTPGYEGFTDENMKAAFQEALPEGGQLFGFASYKPITASGKDPVTNYYDTKVPADMDVYLAFTNQLDGVGPVPPSGGQDSLYFAVGEDRERPDPKKIQAWLNDKQPVEKFAVTGDVLDRLKQEAIDAL